MTHSTGWKAYRCRKERPCGWCFEPLAKGEVYFRETGTFEGAWYVNELHGECKEAAHREWAEWGRMFDDCISIGERHLRGKTLDESESLEPRNEQ